MRSAGQRTLLRRRTIIGLGVALMLAGACAPGGPTDDRGEPLEALSIVTASGTHSFLVEIADDDAERAQGLMYRLPLEDDRGMLFQFPDMAERGFWMRNTPSSLDIIYIDNAGRIVSIAQHTTPNSDANIPSYGPAKGVLEVRAGRAAEIGARAGDQVIHPFFTP
jgi:uncharacterized membrane protein (UPF0127 family)